MTGERFRSTYKSEAQLCDAFVEYVKGFGWQVYPEHGGFDMLLVKDGVQVGVEAKLRCNLEVVSQALNSLRYRSAGACPNYIGILVPKISGALRTVCRELHLHTWDHRCMFPKYSMPAEDLGLRSAWESESESRVWLPEVAVQGSAGRPSPKAMSGWRIKALKICILFKRKGYLTRLDIIKGGCAPTRWTQDWMRFEGQEAGPNGRPVARYVPKSGTSMPSHGYEAEMAILEASDGTSGK